MASARKPAKSPAPATDYRNAVKYSRAGDVFHYRWAARRCLRMIDPQTGIESITVEGSQEPLAPGEYVIDLSEYSVPEKKLQRVRHFQLKHSTVRKHEEFTLSDLTKTLKGFADRFIASKKPAKSDQPRRTFSFALVTNRKVAKSVTDGVTHLAAGAPEAAFEKQLTKYTKLTGQPLREFCQALSFLDREGDYLVQKRKLQGEMTEFLAGFVDGDDAELIVSLVSDRVMPESENGRSDGQIVLEDVLQKLGVTSQRDLFPAPPLFDPLANPIRREQHVAIRKHILSKAAPAIIHAAGGVGKSVVARLIADDLPAGSQAIIYDCFGAGRYLSPSEPRHRARDALVQIANELAARGLCRTLIPRRGLAADDFFRDFLKRLAEAVRRLREINPDALLLIIIDAADNAEMAAKDNNDPCFASALLKCSLPVGCRLALFARTERVPLLKPAPNVRAFPLANFSEHESLAHLRRSFPTASVADGREFFRLSGGNPRVQANALVAGGTVDAVLSGLGPQTTTLDAQIGAQLRAAVDKVKALHTGSTNEQVDAICYGLANLPPLIPIPVLAAAAGVTPETVKSFVADLGRPLWHSDDAVQFRDEPTETWFRQQFAADSAQVKAYVATLEPLTQQSSYVAKALPQLLLRAGEYERLVTIALADTHLPSNNPIEQRNVRVYRLQFAFKAAIKLSRLMDASRLAFRAGEEVAGDQRQTELLTRNVDLVASLEEPNRVQEIAYRHLLGGGWPGCEHIYSAALLSSFADFKGDARAFLRSAHRRLDHYFKDRAKKRKKLKKEERLYHHQEPLHDDHLVELWWARYNLMGAGALVDDMVTWKPQDLPFRLMRVIVRRLIDATRFPAVDELARIGKKVPFLMLAIADELNAVGRLPPKGTLQPSLMFFDHATDRPSKRESYRVDDSFSPALVSILEACAAHRLTARTIRRTLDYYDDPHNHAVLGSDYQEGGRALFLRRAMLRAVLAKQSEPKVEDLVPKKDPKAPHDHDDDNRDQMLSSLIPWHYVRTRLILGASGAKKIDLQALRSRTGSGHGRYRQFDRLPHELSAIRFEVLTWKPTATPEELTAFIQETLPATQIKYWLPDRLDATHAACRLDHLTTLRDPLEQSCRADLEVIDTDGPNERADYYVRLGRAVLAQNHDDAVAYFGMAVDAVAKFGDEMVARWEAVVAVANRSAEPGQVSAELIYRFVRCAEMIGDTVAREKYWSRDDVFRVAVRLDLAGAFAAASRWRDRNVGWFHEHLEALAIASVETGVAAPVALWGLSGFGGCNDSLEFAQACLRAEIDPSRREQLLERIVHDAELAGCGPDRWAQLHALSRELNLPCPRLTELLRSVPSASSAVAAKPTGPVSDLKATEEKRWGGYFRRTKVDQPGAVDTALRKFNASVPRDPDVFWTELLKSVPRNTERKMLRQVAASEELDFYDSGCVVKFARANWLGRAAVRTEWPLFLQTLGRRFTSQFSDRGRLSYWQRSDHAHPTDILEIRRGVLTGLADSLDLVDAGTFFGFVTNTANDLMPAEARTLLAYALERFERHVDLPTYADGPFQPWLSPACNAPSALSGLVWSALGSPFVETRWEAAHCLRRWAELGCDLEVDALVDWARQGTAGAFASRKLPFYTLHAKLYALLAFARIAIDHPRNLARHAAWFADVALTGMPHWLIQKTAAETALAIEGEAPGTYLAATVTNLRNVGRSILPPVVVTNSTPKVDSPRHASGQVDTSLKFHFGLDFGDSWLRPLGGAFGVPQSQVEELTREVLVKEMGVPPIESYPIDPRQNQWNSRDRDTWLHKSSYPRADDHRFYLWYHGMMSVAPQLLAALPAIVQSHRTWSENEWEGWANRHGLTRDDGRWLADRRDPDPRVRRPWLNLDNSSDWLWSISPDDFFAILQKECPLANGLCVQGRWSDCSDSRSETIWVESVLVDPQTSHSLANALRHGHGPRYYRLPSYKGTDEEISGPAPFDMLGWTIQPEGDDRHIDSFDPYAKAMTDPPLDIGPTFTALLGLSADHERRAWRKQPAGEVLALGEIWSDRDENNFSRRDSPYRWGRRLSAKVSLLRELCAITKRDLVISVGVDRDRKDGYDKKYEDIPPSHKVFIFSADGRLIDATKSHHLG